MSFTEKYDLNPQSPYFNVILENRTEDAFAIKKDILGCIGFPEKCKVTQPEPQPYTVFNVNHVTQTLLYNIYPDTVDVKNDYAPITTQFDVSPFRELT